MSSQQMRPEDQQMVTASTATITAVPQRRSPCKGSKRSCMRYFTETMSMIAFISTSSSILSLPKVLGTMLWNWGWTRGQTGAGHRAMVCMTTTGIPTTPGTLKSGTKNTIDPACTVDCQSAEKPGTVIIPGSVRGTPAELFIGMVRMRRGTLFWPAWQSSSCVYFAAS